MLKSRDQNLIPFVSLLPFTLIAFGLAWAILALFIFQPEVMISTFGNLTGQHPLFFLCVYSPAIAAFIMVFHFSGLKGLRRFFSRFFIANYCPLAFMESTGRNRTPDKLPLVEREPLLAACDRALVRTVELVRPQIVIGVGAFAEGRARAALDGLDIRIGRILHPSPASPAANRGWAERATRELRALGVDLP